MQAAHFKSRPSKYSKKRGIHARTLLEVDDHAVLSLSQHLRHEILETSGVLKAGTPLDPNQNRIRIGVYQIDRLRSIGHVRGSMATPSLGHRNVRKRLIVQFVPKK